MWLCTREKDISSLSPMSNLPNPKRGNELMRIDEMLSVVEIPCHGPVNVHVLRFHEAGEPDKSRQHYGKQHSCTLPKKASRI